MKKIFIIGANSAFAKAAIPVLTQKYAIFTAGKKDCDITKPFTIPDDIDVIINFAAVFGGESNEEIIDEEKVNTLGALHVCMAAQKAGVGHIILISSLSALHSEDSSYYSIYAITKKHADELATFYCKAHKIPLTIIRPSQIYGDDDSFAKHQPFFYEAVNKAEKGKDITIYGKHDALRNYVQVVDLSEVLSRVVAKQVTGIYACMHPTDVSFSQVADTAQRVFAMGGQVVFLEDKPDIADNVFSKDLAIYDKVGYRPEISLEMGIKRIKEYRERQST